MTYVQLHIINITMFKTPFITNISQNIWSVYHNKILAFKVLKSLVILMAKDWQSKYDDADWEIMWETARFSRKLSLVCILLAEGTITAQCMVVLMFDVYSRGENERPLYMHSYFPFNTQISPNYEFTWFGQFMCTVYAASAFSSVDAFFGVLVLHLCGQLSVLKRNLKELGSDAREKIDPDEFTRKIAALVDRHDHLNMYVWTMMGFQIVGEQCQRFVFEGSRKHWRIPSIWCSYRKWLAHR